MPNLTVRDTTREEPPLGGVVREAERDRKVRARNDVLPAAKLELVERRSIEG